jgi:HK97 family phage major capsid protein
MHHRLIGQRHTNALERKDDAGNTPATPEWKKLADELLSTVATFRKENDAHLDEIKALKKDDVVLREKVDRINATIDELQDKLTKDLVELKRQRTTAEGNAAPEAPELVEYKTALQAYFRGDYGSEEKPRELKKLMEKAVEVKALATSSDADGGFTVIPQVDQNIRELQLLVSPIRQVAQVQAISSNLFKVLWNNRGTVVGVVGETDPRTQTATSQLREMDFVPGEYFALPLVTQQMLEDSFFNVEQWVMNEVMLALSVQEGKDFINGNGVKRPKGFLTYQIVADASQAHGSIGYIPTGASAGFLPTQTSPSIQQGADVFFDLIGALKPQYRPTSSFVNNRRTTAVLRKIKSAFADYLWVPGLQNGQNDSFAGYPITEAEDMPNIAASSNSIVFGDMRQFYLVVDRVGMSVLRDPYTYKPYVGYYVRKRTGGGVQNFEAAKVLRFSVS